ncbi:uncharacterized protein [Rutidosis leptorrhynchoides]|uniref:uncharacterized protein n=1 Tax=Rutidosis leptorrhynchoides TaxID=125765 RepID=UPI003A98DB71
MHFEELSGLKINVSKSCLCGIGITPEALRSMARCIGCAEGKLPLKYLGLTVGSKMNCESDWLSIVEKFQKRFSDWKAKTLSFGGMLTLIKSVVTSFPLYFFSIFRAPVCILKLLEQLRCKFFWGGSSNKSKLHWAKWVDILKSYELDGLNIGSLRAKNWALLSKWWWKFLTETDSLWVKVIKSIYGRDGGLGISFISSLIGKGTNTLLWSECWNGPYSFKEKFPRIFRLESDKECRICDRISWNGTSWDFKWWMRDLTGRNKEELDNLLAELPTNGFSNNELDE